MGKKKKDDQLPPDFCPHCKVKCPCDQTAKAPNGKGELEVVRRYFCKDGGHVWAHTTTEPIEAPE